MLIEIGIMVEVPDGADGGGICWGSFLLDRTTSPNRGDGSNTAALARTWTDCTRPYCG